MSVEISLLSGPNYIELPQGWIGWLGWLSLLGLVIFVNWRGVQYNQRWTANKWGLFISLVFLIPLTSLFIVIRLPAGGALPPPSKPVDPLGPALVVFSALPWVLGAGLLGPAPASILAALAGSFLAPLDTHSLFTPLELALLATVLGVFLNQRYRTLLFRTLRHPLFSCLALSVVYPLVFLMDTVFLTGGPLAIRLDYAITHGSAVSLAVMGELLVAGLFAEGITRLAPVSWGRRGPLQPSPAELNLETRFLYNIAPLAALLLINLSVGVWVVAGNAARQLLRERMGSAALVSAETVPFFIETGQNLISQLAEDPDLLVSPERQLPGLLAEDLRSVPYFNQLFLLDEQGDPVTGYPAFDYLNSNIPPNEALHVELVLNGVPFQFYPTPPEAGESSAIVTFLSAVMDKEGQLQGVLIGRTDVGSNPFMQPLLTSLKSLAEVDGEGLLLDSSGRVLYRQNSDLSKETYTTYLDDQTRFSIDTSPDGTRRLVYYQPVNGYPWGIELAVPARRSQQLALNIATPLLGMLMLLFVVAFVLLRIGLRRVTISLQTLSMEAKRIASGQLDHSLAVSGEDEVAQLRRAFEQMRSSLKSRLDELNSLLLVSERVASTLEMEKGVQPVLETILATGAQVARVVLSPLAMTEVAGDNTIPNSFGIGKDHEFYAELDGQILDLTRQRPQVLLTNLNRVRILSFPAGVERPKALLALALHHEQRHYGTLWMVYDHHRQFSEEEIRFLSTLAGQAALAAANARLFQTAEVGRQRLAAILASTPDPVLVTDNQNRLLLANPAAWQVLGLNSEAGERMPVEKVIAQKELVKVLRSTTSEKHSAEISMPDGHIYLASVSPPVQADGQSVGRVCLLRDITYFKELDSLKSEFVSTVSHDLRFPLNLIHGYATMLEVVGTMTEQQSGYLSKIISGVEGMQGLVGNLLDLGRIEAGVGLQLEMVMVREVVEKVIANLQSQAAQKRIQLEAEISSHTIPLIQADQALLKQALQNLVDNAIKFTGQGGKVTIQVHAQQNRMIFQVSDTGIGIAPVDQPRLFEKFYKVTHAEAQKKHGSGLGLAIVRSIAQRHGGEVGVESQLGRGSRFFMAIPLRQPKPEAPRVTEKV